MTRAVIAATLLVAVLAVADWINPVKAGLTGTYYANATWTDPPAVAVRDPQPSNDRLTEAWQGRAPREFTVTWAGSFLAMHDGPYGFGTISDDGSVVYVDGQIVVDNSGRRDWPRGATGLVTLTRGVHAIYIRYAQEGGPSHIELLWARVGQPLERMPAWALTPRRVSVWAFAASAGLRRALAAAEWLWVGAIVFAAFVRIWAGLLRIRRWLEREGVWPAMRWVLGVSLILNAAAIWWGLPGGSWAPDEISPVLVIGGVARRFAHGWFDRYPPFHYYVLTLVSSPMLILDWLGQIDLSASAPYALMTLISRLVSLAAAAGTLLATYACAARTFGKRAGIFAAATISLVPPFVYYAKTANLDVPYLFWFALSLVFYLRFLERPSRRDLLAFAACGTIAICTKDQAYGLYLLTPIPIVFRLWQANRDDHVPQPFARALFSPALAWAAALSIGVFIAGHNLLFNVSGFVEHVRYITGGGSETYRDFEPTLAGRVALFRLSADLVRVSFGWPLLVASLAGAVLALLTPAYRRAVFWLAIPVVSYYLFFINIVLYNYDRFMLPVCLVMALFAGLAWDRWLSDERRGRSWRAAVAGVAFACSMLYAATVDLAMLRDSRYTVEQWLAAHVGPGDVVGYVFPPQYYPRLDRYNNNEVTSIGQLQQERPSFYVLNEDYGRAEPPDSGIGRLIAHLQNGNSGYKLVFRYREPAPWPWLPGAPRDLVGERKERPITSVLRQINPWYEVFRKTP
jgi:hypothetical protein